MRSLLLIRGRVVIFRPESRKNVTRLCAGACGTASGSTAYSRRRDDVGARAGGCGTKSNSPPRSLIISRTANCGETERKTTEMSRRKQKINVSKTKGTERGEGGDERRKIRRSYSVRRLTVSVSAASLLSLCVHDRNNGTITKRTNAIEYVLLVGEMGRIIALIINYYYKA